MCVVIVLSVCDLDENFLRINLTDKIGVDPKSGGTHRMTSDEFFFNNKKKFDLIYIDGLHTYEQTINDIKNSLNFLNEDGIILLHDCLPKKIWNQVVPRIYGHWNGDVWKAIVECRVKENIDTYTCYADFGIGVIFNRKNKNPLKLDSQNFSKINFEDYFHKHKEFMNIIKYEDLIKIL